MSFNGWISQFTLAMIIDTFGNFIFLRSHLLFSLLFFLFNIVLKCVVYLFLQLLLALKQQIIFPFFRWPFKNSNITYLATNYSKESMLQPQWFILSILLGDFSSASQHKLIFSYSPGLIASSSERMSSHRPPFLKQPFHAPLLPFILC